MTRRASAASRLIWASSSLSATAPSIPDPPATIKVSTGPVTSPIADDANSSPQLARTGPPPVVTTWVRYRTAGRNREALEKTSSGPVTSRI